MRVMLASATVLAMIAAGCKVGPDYHAPPTTAPAAWGETAEPAITARSVEITRWWTRFNDPQLDSLIDRAAKSNYDLQVADARLRQARAAYGFAEAELWPTADVSGSYANQRMSRNQPLLGSLPAANAIQLENNVYQVGFDASWEIDVFGGNRRALEAAKADVAASAENRNDVLVSLLAEVARDYVELRGLQRRLAITRDNIKLQREAVELTRARFEGGITSELDLSQASALLASTQSQVPVLETAIKQRLHQLALLLGREPTALADELSAEKAIPPVPPQVPVGLPSELLRRRPDVRRAERQLAAETARIGVATAELFPKFAINGNYGYQSIDANSLFDADSRMWSIGPSVRWRIFDAGRVKANIRLQTAKQEEAWAVYEKAVLVSLRDVEDTLTAYAKEQVRLQSLAEEAKQDQRSLEVAQALYDEGRANYLNVLDAQRSLYQAQDKVAQSQQAVTQNLIAVYKALGGGWQTDEGSPQ